VASLSQGRTAAAQCGLFTHKSVPVIFEPPCTYCIQRAYPMERYTNYAEGRSRLRIYLYRTTNSWLVLLPVNSSLHCIESTSLLYNLWVHKIGKGIKS